MNRRTKAKAATNAAVKPNDPAKQTPPPARSTPPAKPSQAQATANATPFTSNKVPGAPALSKSDKLRQEWKSFEAWLSTCRADRDRRLSERLKELMSAKSKGMLQKPPMDMATYGVILSTELAEQARIEWLKRLGAVGLNEEDWVDITEDEMKAVESAFAPPDADDADVDAAQYNTASAFAPPSAIQDWSASVPGAWESPGLAAGASNTKGKLKTEPSAPARKSPLSNSWSLFDEKVNAPSAESIWEAQTKQKTPNPPTLPSSSIPTPDTLWEMNMRKTAPPPPTPPTEPVSPDSPWEKSAAKKQPGQQVNGYAELNSTKKPAVGKPEKQPTADSLWNSRAPASPPEPPEPVAAHPMHTGNSLESSHNHGYMSPLLIELECDEFPLAPADILTDELVEESIRQWHQQAAEADVQLRRELVAMHWSKRDWDELLGSHVQEMERNARTVVGHWKSICDAEKARRLKEDKQRRLAGIRNVTSGNRRWGGSPTPAEPAPPSAPTLAANPVRVKPLTSNIKEQVPRRGATKARAATVEDATSSEWEERSPTASFSSDKSKTRPQESPERDSMWQREAANSKAAPGLMSSLWGKVTATAPEPQPIPTAKTAMNGASKSTPPPMEALNNSATPPPWEHPQAGKPDTTRWTSRAAAEEEDADSNSGWGGASAWSFAMNAIAGDKAPAAAKPNGKPAAAPAMNRQTSFWSSGDPMARAASQAPAVPGLAEGIDGRFTPWKPSRAADVETEADGPTKKMADLALQHLYETTNDDYDPGELHNAMSMYTKAVSSTNRKRVPPARA